LPEPYDHLLVVVFTYLRDYMFYVQNFLDLLFLAGGETFYWENSFVWDYFFWVEVVFC
jgi:hypothetical protein